MQTRPKLRSSAVLHLLAAASLLSVVACSANSQNTLADNGGSGGSGNGGGGSSGGSGGEDTIAGSGGSTGSTISESCGSSTFANQVPGSILVVLDKSGSMGGGNGVADKWGPTVQAVKAMMSAAGPDLGMGLLPFPEGKFDDSGLVTCTFDPSTPQCAALFADGGCEDIATTPVVAVAPLATSMGPITSWLDSNGPGGGTPTLGALKNAYEAMRNVDVPGERFVLLLTDGEPTTHQPEQSLMVPGFPPIVTPESNVLCGDLPDIEAEATAAAMGTPKVKTFVIGSPGSESAGSFLSQLAINGETQKSANCSAGAKNCHYQIGQANYQQELEAVLADIAGKLSECVFEIPDGENADPDYVNVNVETGGGKTQLYKDPAHADGWDYTDDGHTKVELFGPACEKFKAQKDAQVSIILGCKTEVK
jgi:hypothetical protein